MSAHLTVEIYCYEEAGHGFNCDMRSSYHSPSAALAYERALTLLKKQLA